MSDSFHMPPTVAERLAVQLTRQLQRLERVANLNAPPQILHACSRLVDETLTAIESYADGHPTLKTLSLPPDGGAIWGASFLADPKFPIPWESDPMPLHLRTLELLEITEMLQQAPAPVDVQSGHRAVIGDFVRYIRGRQASAKS